MVKDSNTAANDMNHDLDLIGQWAYAWRTSFNPDLVGETRYALSEETYVSPRAVGYSSCAVAIPG